MGIKYHNVTIKAAAEPFDNRRVGEITIDGVPLRGVVRFGVESDIETPTLVTVSFYANVNHVSVPKEIVDTNG